MKWILLVMLSKPFYIPNISYIFFIFYILLCGANFFFQCIAKERGMQTLAEDPNQKQILLRQISATVRPSRTKAIVSDDETKDETWVTKKGAVNLLAPKSLSKLGDLINNAIGRRLGNIDRIGV